MIYSLALRYAKSFLFLAKKKELLDLYQKQWCDIWHLILKSPNLKLIFNNPQITTFKKLKIVDEIFGNQNLEKEVINFFRLLITKNRFFLFEEIYNVFNDLYLKEKNTSIVELTTSETIEKSKEEKIKYSLEKFFETKVELKTKVDTEILGGIIVRTGSYLVDGSLKNFLTQIKNNIEK